jgi:predicted amidohydrolase
MNSRERAICNLDWWVNERTRQEGDDGGTHIIDVVAGVESENAAGPSDQWAAKGRERYIELCTYPHAAARVGCSECRNNRVFRVRRLPGILAFFRNAS